jgi:hypothetical protein
VRLGVGKRVTSPTVAMILAARMGPTPKISVRVVPEASTSASMRPLRSAIFLSSVRTSRKISEANRLRRRDEVPLGLMPRTMRAALSAESVRVRSLRPNGARRTASLKALEGPQAFSRSCGKRSRSSSSSVASSSAATATPTPCGDRPRSRRP